VTGFVSGAGTAFHVTVACDTVHVTPVPWLQDAVMPLGIWVVRTSGSSRALLSSNSSTSSLSDSGSRRE
jgi:hypothetical protein